MQIFLHNDVNLDAGMNLNAKDMVWKVQYVKKVH